MKIIQTGSPAKRTLAAFLVAGTLSFAGSARAAETATAASAPVSAFGVANPTANLTYGAMNYGVSSSSADATAEERDVLADPFDASQPPPRRRTYGRPRYNDKYHNKDGSTKIAFEFGGGFNSPAGATGHYQTIGYKFSVGGGLNFSKAFGVLLQYDYDNMGIPKSILTTMQNYYIGVGVSPSDVAGLDGNTHLWSLTVNPVINFQGSGHAGAYIVGGAGYYRKTTNFTLPQSGYYCDYYYGCYPVTSNQTFDSYHSGALGVNGGVGVTYKFNNFSSSRLFAEARYTWVNNEKNSTLFYQPNSYRTGYFPVTVGVRW